MRCLLMNRDDFFKWLYLRFKKHWADKEHFETIKDDYKDVFSTEVDYEALKKATNRTYQYHTPPAPAYFYNLLIEIREAKSQEIKKFVPPTGGVAPPDDVRKQILELSEKLAMNKRRRYSA